MRHVVPPLGPLEPITQKGDTVPPLVIGCQRHQVLTELAPNTGHLRGDMACPRIEAVRKLPLLFQRPVACFQPHLQEAISPEPTHTARRKSSGLDLLYLTIPSPARFIMSFVSSCFSP